MPLAYLDMTEIWQMKTPLTRLCECCLIYRPETNFCQHQHKKIGATNTFLKEIYFRILQINSRWWCDRRGWLWLGSLQVCQGGPKALGSKLMNYPISFLVVLIFCLGGYPKKIKVAQGGDRWYIRRGIRKLQI